MPSKKVRDPIHDYILLDEGALAVINSPPFQRLRRVRQLGTASYVYPGAQHTRFEHGLGAMHLARLAAESLGLPEAEALDLRMAALLHDVGHGPFSHMTEALFFEATGLTHVDAGRAIVVGELASSLRESGSDPKRVASLMAGEGELGGLIAGDLDVDRMDYLVRDSHYTGVDIGVDLYRIVTALHPLPAGFAIDESAIAAAEMLLATRSMMYATVYYHPTCRAAEVMLERAIRLAAIEGLLAPGEFPRLDDVHVIAALRRSRGLAADLFDSLENRRLLKLAAAFSFGDLAPAPRRDGDLPWADSKRREAAEAAIAQAVGIDAAWVVVDAPELPPANAVDIQVQTSDGLSLLRERSTLVAGLPKGRLDHWRLRVYVPASVRVEAEPAARRAVRELFAS